MNDKKPIMIMMVGLPASGKSTYAKELAKEIDAQICSSDEIRKELYGDENSQKNNKRVFSVLHSRVKEHLKNGVNVIYDATSINSAGRKSFLLELNNIPCIKRCVVMATSFKECCKMNEKRNRTVPFDVIKRMRANFSTPTSLEGWNEITFVFRDENNSKKKPIDYLHF